MVEQQRRRARVWWLSGLLAVLGAGIAFFAAMGQLTATLTMVALAVIVTVLLGIVLAYADR